METREKSTSSFYLEVIDKSSEKKQVLFDLFNERDETLLISGDKGLNYQNHCRFVDNHPYREWFLIKTTESYLGTLYLTYTNHIGVSLITGYFSYLEKVLAYVLDEFQPLPAIDSIRAEDFHINISINNDEYSKILENMGGNLYQKTYRLKARKMA